MRNSPGETIPQDDQTFYIQKLNISVSHTLPHFRMVESDHREQFGISPPIF